LPQIPQSPQMVWLLRRLKGHRIWAKAPVTSCPQANQNLRNLAASAAEICSGVRLVHALSYP